MIILVLITVAIIIVVLIVVYQSNDKEACDKAYNEELLKITEEKGDMKLTTEILQILSEEGYRPTLEQGIDCEMIAVKINGDIIGLFFPNDDPNYILIKYHTYTFEPKQRSEVFEWINEVNTKMKFISMTIEEDNQVYTTCSSIFHNDANLKNMLLRYLEVVVCAHNEFWELQKAKIALD